MLPDNPSSLTDDELLTKARLAVEVAAGERAEVNEQSEPNEDDAELLGENPFRSGLIIHNKASTRVLIGYGAEEVTDKEFSFPIPSGSTYHPSGQTWDTVPKGPVRYRFDGGASGKLTVTELQLGLSPEAKQLIAYVRDKI